MLNTLMEVSHGSTVVYVASGMSPIQADTITADFITHFGGDSGVVAATVAAVRAQQQSRAAAVAASRAQQLLSAAPAASSQGTKRKTLEPVHFNIKSQDGIIMQFKAKQETLVGAVLDAVARRLAVEVSSLYLLFEGERAHRTTSLAELELEDDDTFDLIIFQVGC